MIYIAGNSYLQLSFVVYLDQFKLKLIYFDEIPSLACVKLVFYNLQAVFIRALFSFFQGTKTNHSWSFIGSKTQRHQAEASVEGR